MKKENLCPKCDKKGKEVKMIEHGWKDGTYWEFSCPECEYKTRNISLF